jgi:replication factor C subunit 3/5
VVVILEADKLSKEAQHSLRRTMEKYSSNLRLILCANTAGKVITPIKSRCTILRIPGIDASTMNNFLQTVCAEESIKINEQILKQICASSAGNLRKALLMLEHASNQ